METKQDIEIIEYDLKENTTELSEELKGNGFFKFEEGETYKISLNSTKVKLKQFAFDNEDGTKNNITRYEVEIKSKCSDNTEYEGVALLPKPVMREIFTKYSDNAVFTISKTGTGRNTKYNVSKDF